MQPRPHHHPSSSLATKLVGAVAGAVLAGALADALAGPVWALAAAALVGTLLAWVVAAPARRLARSVQRGEPLGRYPRDEVGVLAAALEGAHRRLEEAQEQLARSERMAAFGALGAGITHEVKNPITALVGFAQLAQKKLEDRDKVAELLRIIESEGLRCRDILSNFLKFARSTGRTWEPLDVNQMVQETARVLRHQLVIANVQLELELGEGLPRVVGSTSELQQVLVNLALNAQQAMPGGGSVRLATRVDGLGVVVISVADNGPGIPGELCERIFEPFFTTKPPGEGTGLGLAISAQIVKAHDGAITVESAPGGGATFTIRLPAARESGKGAAVPPQHDGRASGAR